MKKVRTGYIVKENGLWVVRYRINGIREYIKEFIKKSEAVKFLWQGINYRENWQKNWFIN